MPEIEFRSMTSSVVLTARDAEKVRTSVVIPAVIISIAVLVPFLCFFWRWHTLERITPVYVQERLVEEPRLSEVALVDTGHGGCWSFKTPLPHPWCRLRPLSIRSYPYEKLPDLARRPSCCDITQRYSSSSNRPRSQGSGTSDHTPGTRGRRLSQLRVGVLVSMPSPQASSGRTPLGERSPIPPLYLGITDVLHLDDRA